MPHQSLLERDPVCGMQVDPARVRAKVDHGGRTYFFCCSGCAGKFEATPEQYLKPRDPASHAPRPVLTVISPSVAPAPRPADAPAAAITEHVIPSAAVGDYTCPMDPDVHQSSPGACPKCGMALEAAVPVVPSAALIAWGRPFCWPLSTACSSAKWLRLLTRLVPALK